MVDVCTTEESNVTYELGVLEELQTVFNPQMAHASYIPFYCLIGRRCLVFCNVILYLMEIICAKSNICFVFLIIKRYKTAFFCHCSR